MNKVVLRSLILIDAEIKEKAVRIIRAIEKRNIHCVDAGYAQRENQSKLN